MQHVQIPYTQVKRVTMGTEKSKIFSHGSLAQLGEHLPYKQRVIGSIPITSTKSAGMAELADALDLGSSD